MKQIILPLILILNVLSVGLTAQDSKNFPTIGKIHRFDPRLDELVAEGTQIEVITSGFTWSEGPVWVPRGNYLLFSEIPSNTVMKWVEGEGVSAWLHPSGYTGQVNYGREPGSNGLRLDREGRLVSCEHGDRRISVLTHEGGKRTLADNYNGKRFNSPNDLTIKSNGDIYFTDPPYGLPDGVNDARREMDYCGVFLLRTGGEVELLTKDLPRPNGVALSPDERTLYVAQSYRDDPVVMAYALNQNGTIESGRELWNASSFLARGKGLPDGLKVDRKGNIWTSGPGGVFVLSSEGDLLGWIETGEATSNCAFGGANNSELFITADTYVCRVQTLATGF